MRPKGKKRSSFTVANKQSKKQWWKSPTKRKTTFPVVVWRQDQWWQTNMALLSTHLWNALSLNKVWKNATVGLNTNMLKASVTKGLIKCGSMLLRPKECAWDTEWFYEGICIFQVYTIYWKKTATINWHFIRHCMCTYQNRVKSS